MKRVKYIMCLLTIFCVNMNAHSAVNAAEKTVHNKHYAKRLLDQQKDFATKHTKRYSNGCENICEEIKCPSKYAVSYKKIRCKPECGPKINLIKQCHFCDDGENGIILNKPGIYKLAEDISFCPTQERTTAITIASSNVILDMDTFTLSQCNKTNDVYGIAVCRDVSCVKITGESDRAKIVDFSLVGIRVLGRTDDIRIENITTTQSVPATLTLADLPDPENVPAELLCAKAVAGIVVGEGDTEWRYMSGTSRYNKVTNLSLENVTTSKCVIGTQILFTSNYEITNSNFIENFFIGLLNGSISVISDGGPSNNPMRVFPLAENGVIRDCHFDKNLRTDSPFALGFRPFNTFLFNDFFPVAVFYCDNMLFENCTINNNVTSNHGFAAAHHSASKNITWRNSEVKGNEGIELFEGFRFSGFFATLPVLIFTEEDPVSLSQPPSSNILLENCEVSGNIGKETQDENALARAFHFEVGQGVKLVNCCAIGNQAGISGISVGFSFLGEYNFFEFPPLFFWPTREPTYGVSVSNCTAIDNGTNDENPDEELIGKGVGFFVDINCKDMVFKNCTAIRNGLVSNGLSAGFAIQPALSENPDDELFNENIRDIIFEDCIANGNGSENGTISGGFIISNPFYDNEFATNLTKIENVLIQKSTSASNTGFGFLVDGDITGAIIKKCEADQNDDGFVVTNNQNPVLVTKNISYDNAGDNYIGIPMTTIVEGDTANLPNVNNMQNASIVPA